MSYIGSSAAPLPVAFSGPQSEGFDGGTATFTLSRSVAKVTDIEVVINNVPQSPYDGSYSVSGSTLTTSETVSAGTKNVIVKYRDIALGSLNPLKGSIDKSKLDVASLDGTGAAHLPSGTSAQRPAAPQIGMVRLNTSNNEPEFYNGAEWKAFSQQAPGLYAIDYVVVGGGGGGGSGNTGVGAQPNGGGGGGGGTLIGSTIVTAASAFNIVVGAGGAMSGVGSATTGFALSAGGGSAHSGMSGGASGTPQSNAGGGSTTYAGGGGGGSGGAGTSGYSTYYGGAGGTGLLASNFTGFGQSGYFGGGGGGGQASGGGAGGMGGGGSSNSGPGTANTGGGGSGGYGSPNTGAAGGSGVVVIRYSGTPRGTGGTITQSGGYTYHRFTTSGTFTA